jgi:ribosomal protein S21
LGTILVVRNLKRQFPEEGVVETFRSKRFQPVWDLE